MFANLLRPKRAGAVFGSGVGIPKLTWPTRSDLADGLQDGDYKGMADLILTWSSGRSTTS